MSNFFRKDMNDTPYLYPSIELKNSEIAKVCQEINTNYKKYQDKKFILHRTKDTEGYWCIYYIENRGFGDYNIVEKYYD